VRAVGLAAAWGAIDETHQLFVPGRQASLWDFATDVAGAALFVSVLVILRGERVRWPRIATPLAGIGAAITVAGATFG
jgi:VanZ family protein